MRILAVHRPGVQEHVGLACKPHTNRAGAGHWRELPPARATVCGLPRHRAHQAVPRLAVCSRGRHAGKRGPLAFAASVPLLLVRLSLLHGCKLGAMCCGRCSPHAGRESARGWKPLIAMPQLKHTQSACTCTRLCCCSWAAFRHRCGLLPSCGRQRTCRPQSLAPSPGCAPSPSCARCRQAAPRALVAGPGVT